MQQDPVEQILQQWASVRPELDCSAMGVVGRIRRYSKILGPELEQVFKQHQLTSIEFDILATLRRSDQALTPTQLYQTLMLSSGAMSTRIEGLVQRGLVQRIASGEDRRSCKVALTRAGQALIDPAVNNHVANLQRLLQPLDQQEQRQLADLLRKLLLANEG